MKHKLKFFMFIINRSFSGIVNGLFYAGSKLWFPALILLAGFTLFMLINDLIHSWCNMSKFNRILSILGIIGSLVSLIMVGTSFRFPKSKFSDIHYWTWSSQTTIAGTQTVTTQDKWWKNIWWQLLAVSPSAFLQKLFINIIPGNKWNYSGTDDVTGKTWSMKIFGKKIKVPRLGNMKVKLIIAVVCVGTFLLVEHNKIKKQQKEIQKTEYKTKRPQV